MICSVIAPRVIPSWHGSLGAFAALSWGQHSNLVFQFPLNLPLKYALVLSVCLDKAQFIGPRIASVESAANVMMGEVQAIYGTEKAPMS